MVKPTVARPRLHRSKSYKSSWVKSTATCPRDCTRYTNNFPESSYTSNRWQNYHKRTQILIKAHQQLSRELSPVKGGKDISPEIPDTGKFLPKLRLVRTTVRAPNNLMKHKTKKAPMLSNRSSSRVAATNKFRPDAKSCLATLHNRNDMANLFTASSWNQLYPGIKILKVMLEVLDTSWTSSFWLTGTLTPIMSPDQMSRRYCNLCALRWYSACLAPRQLSKQEDSETLLSVKTANRHG